MTRRAFSLRHFCVVLSLLLSLSLGAPTIGPADSVASVAIRVWLVEMAATYSGWMLTQRLFGQARSTTRTSAGPAGAEPSSGTASSGDE